MILTKEEEIGSLVGDDGKKIVFNVKLPDGSIEPRVFYKEDIPERQEGETEIVRIVRTVELEWIKEEDVLDLDV